MVHDATNTPRDDSGLLAEVFAERSWGRGVATGELVAVDAALAAAAGFIVPVAVTRTVWNACVTTRGGAHDTTGEEADRLHGVLAEAVDAFRRVRDTTVEFEALSAPRGGHAGRQRPMRLAACLCLNDDDQTVATVLDPRTD